MRVTTKMPSLSNVAAGGTGTLNMPPGRTYELLTLVYSGVTRAQMKNLRIKIDGKPIMEFGDGDELAAVNAYYGRVDSAGFLTIYFVRPEMNELNHQRVTGIGTGDENGNGAIDTLQFEVDIDAAASSPKIEALAVQSGPSPLGKIIKVKRFTKSSASAGIYEIDSIPQGPRLMAAHFFKANDDISRLELEQNSRKIMEGSKAELQYLQKIGKRVPQTGYLASDFVLEQDITQSVVTDHNIIRDQRFRLTLDTAGVVKILVEYLDNFDGI